MLDDRRVVLEFVSERGLWLPANGSRTAGHPSHKQAGMPACVSNGYCVALWTWSGGSEPAEWAPDELIAEGSEVTIKYVDNQF